MKIALHEIRSKSPLELSFLSTLPTDKWVMDCLTNTEESKSPHLSKNRQAACQFSLTVVDDVFIVNGKVQTYLILDCSRCAEAFAFDCQTNFCMLYCQDPIMAGFSHLANGKEAGKPSKPMETRSGFARHAHDYEGEGQSQIDIAYLQQSFIDLAVVLEEQLRLQIPLRPLCKEDCKGLCAHCATNQNIGRCACEKMKSNRPFEKLLQRRS
jgi:uncharacterized protein